MRKRDANLIVNLIIGCILIGLCIAYWQFIVVAVIVVFIIGMLQVTRCQICGNQLKRTRFEWTVDGQKKKVCSHCNTRLERQNSADAFRKR